MVTAVRNGRVIRISKQTFKKVFEPKGYTVVSDDTHRRKEAEKPTEEKVTEGEGTEEHEEVIDVDSVPVSEMNAKQLKEYAVKHEIDLTEAKNTAQARKIIQREIRKQNM